MSRAPPSSRAHSILIASCEACKQTYCSAFMHGWCTSPAHKAQHICMSGLLGAHLPKAAALIWRHAWPSTCQCNQMPLLSISHKALPFPDRRKKLQESRMLQCYKDVMLTSPSLMQRGKCAQHTAATAMG